MLLPLWMQVAAVLIMPPMALAADWRSYHPAFVPVYMPDDPPEPLLVGLFFAIGFVLTAVVGVFLPIPLLAVAVAASAAGYAASSPAVVRTIWRGASLHKK